MIAANVISLLKTLIPPAFVFLMKARNNHRPINDCDRIS
jgi:hypothetical protein